MIFLENLLEMVLSAGPWLFLGLLISGLIKAWVPDDFIARQLGQQKTTTLIKAALIGAPIPLCSCSVIPVAMSLRRGGASKGSTAAFLVATPETGVDSLSISYALLGPVMMLARLISSLISAVFVGFLVVLTNQRNEPYVAATADSTAASMAGESCCASSAHAASPSQSLGDSCCSHDAVEQSTGCETGGCDTGDSCCGSSSAQSSTSSTGKPETPLTRTGAGIRYAFSQVLDDMVVWLSVGLLAAAAIATWVPETFLAQWGSGLLAMIVVLLVSIPMYICATASTPLAAGLMLAGLSPGATLVFLLAGPATNMTTLGVLRSELGKRATIAYWVGISVSTIGLGLLFDWLLAVNNISINISEQMQHEVVPLWLSAGTSVLLVIAAIKPVRRYLLGR